MVERFNGRISSEVLGINIYYHRALEQVLRGFNVAYNARRQRVLAAKTPNQVVQERQAYSDPTNHPTTNTRAGPCHLTKARLVVEAAKEVSQRDN